MADKRILITGGTGLLGKALIETSPYDYKIAATYVGDYIVKSIRQESYSKLDIKDKNGYERLFHGFHPDVVIHTASIGSPDFAEKNKLLTWEINVNGVTNILSLCEKYNASFIYISSNGIFDGANAPYSESDRAIPINYYGQTKLKGEEITRKAKVPYAIVRPILMYGWNHPFERSNIVTMSLQKMQNNEMIYVYKDVYSNPLFSGNCAEAIWRVIEESKYEIFNIAGKKRASIYDFVKRAAEIFGFNTNQIIPVKQGYFNELVPRPVDTSYKTDKMERALNIMPLSFNEGLEIMLKSKK